MRFTLQDLPVQERPRERLEMLGPTSLSVQELLEIIIANGGRSGSVHRISNELISKYRSLENLESASISQLCQINGVGYAKAAQIKAAMELGKRFSLETFRHNSNQILTSGDAHKLSLYYLKNKKKEYLLLFCLDVHSKLVASPEIVSVGVLDCSLIHPREIFGHAVKNSAAKIMLAHNHPSGSSIPSPQDIEVTEQIYDAGKTMGIELLDHIVIGDSEYMSIRQDHPEIFF